MYSASLAFDDFSFRHQNTLVSDLTQIGRVFNLKWYQFRPLPISIIIVNLRKRYVYHLHQPEGSYPPQIVLGNIQKYDISFYYKIYPNQTPEWCVFRGRWTNARHTCWVKFIISFCKHICFDVWSVEWGWDCFKAIMIYLLWQVEIKDPLTISFQVYRGGCWNALG